MDLRHRVVAACDVSPAWVRRLKQHRRERDCDIAPQPGGGSRGRKIDRSRLAELVGQQPDTTLVELRDRLGLAVTPWPVGLALRQLKLTYKKEDRRRRPGRVACEPSRARPDEASVP